MLLDVLTLIYILCALFLTTYAVSEFILLITWARYRKQIIPTPPLTTWPKVVVQLPIFNEQHVVIRLLNSMAALDYPRDRLMVQLLDDSNDETTEIAAAQIARLQEDGLAIDHIRRADRSGFKAGALAYGLTVTDAEYVLVLDADFVPPRDFLRKTIPHLVANPNIGMVQTRWGHLNPFTNLLTLGQTLALDGHFVVEQTARSRAGWLLNFNGSGGVWRAACIRDAGGWRDLTLTEDLDLSYRAQLKGWRFLYLPDVVVPGELPPQMAAYKQQQARWAKGSTQCISVVLPSLWTSRFSLFQRLMATLHLCQYLPHPLMIILLILTPPLLLSGDLQRLHLSWLGLAGLGPPLAYIVSQRALYRDWGKRLLAFPMLLALGTGIAWTNTRAVIGGLLGRRGEFRRTPKFNQQWQGSGYALRADPNVWIELLLAAYAFWGMSVAYRLNPALVLYLGLYGFSFGLVALWSLADRVALWRAAVESARAQGASA
jgi:cellulose synthase/poly-beta-1,6-N-acetylglucosamine synthase-like glycosyltransferase